MRLNLKIKYKVTVAIFIFFLIYIGINAFFQKKMVMSNFVALEELEAKKDIERCIMAMEREIYHLDNFNNDWAAWDDTYDFVVGKHPEYVDANLTDDTFVSNNLHLIYIINLAGETVYGRIYDEKWQNEIKSDNFPKNFPKDHYLIRHDSIESSKSGIYPTQNGYLFLSSRPIITTNRTGPIHGTIIMARFITESAINELIRQTRVHFKLVNETKSSGKQIRIRPINKDILEVSTVIHDMLGQPAFTLKAQIPRDITKRGASSLVFSLISISLVGILILIGIILFLDLFVFSSLSKLSRKAVDMRAKEDLSISFASDRKDEIGIVSSEFEKARLWIKETNDNLEQMVKERTQALQMVNEQQQVLINVAQTISEERDRDRLIEALTICSMLITNADAGALYLIDKDSGILTARVCKISSLKHHTGGTGKQPMIHATPIPLDRNNPAHILIEVINSGHSINIDDLSLINGKYDLLGIAPWGQHLNYKMTSLLIAPLKDRNQHVVGVLQLANSKNFYTGEIQTFDVRLQDLVAILVSQAAIALSNIKLYQDLKQLFHSFTQSIATAIDEKSPYTGGHIHRVVKLTELIIQAINEADSGYFKDIKLSSDKIDELKLAAWMHDIGKITTPDKVIDKSTRLYAYVDRIDMIEQRLKIIQLYRQKEYLEQILGLYRTGGYRPDKEAQAAEAIEEFNSQIQDDFEFIKWANTSSFLEDEHIERIAKVGSKMYRNLHEHFQYLTKDEIKHLSIRKGTLTEDERAIIEDHVRVTEKMLRQLPFPDEMSNIPTYAAGHHEKLNGSGYHHSLSGENIPLQTRILTVADIFEALTARDRPYRDKPMKLSRAIHILSLMVKDGHIDPNIYQLLTESELFREYAREHLYAEQIDI